MLSLTSRLLISLSLILAGFLGVTGYVLNKTFQESSMDATQDHLLGYAMALIAAAEIKNDGSVYIPNHLPIPRLNQINSGLYAQIVNSQGDLLWQSGSGSKFPFPPVTQMNNTKTAFQISKVSSGQALFNYHYGVTWDLSENAPVYTVNILESLDFYDNEIKNFQKKLWGWLGGVSLMLIAIQGILMRWSLTPLRLAALEIEKIEAGQQTELTQIYPKELQPLTKSLNGVMKSNKQHLARYRNSLSDLAHSLKTPLALLRSAGESKDPQQALEQVVSEQVEQMRKIVDYQLQRASTSGQNPLSKPINIQNIAEKINNTLAKVYAEKMISSSLEIAPTTLFLGDESDLFELLGNTMDNAYKWAESKIKLTIEQLPPYLTIYIEDDGPGIEKNFAKKVLERGIRSDERSGTGIGLAMANDIVQAYEGTITIKQSDLGGCKCIIKLRQNQ